MNIGSLFSRHARYRPNHLAVVFGDQRLSWSEFNCSINRLAHALLNLGIGKGDKVATILPNCLEQLEAYWASAKIGAVVVPSSTLLLEKAMKTLLQDSDAVMLITNADFADKINTIKPALPVSSTAIRLWIHFFITPSVLCLRHPCRLCPRPCGKQSHQTSEPEAG